jgi:hypothetical protein
MKNRVDHRFDSTVENPSPELKSSDHCQGDGSPDLGAALSR